jgi:hypothetical protein
LVKGKLITGIYECYLNALMVQINRYNFMTY